jgi:aspartyl-tRNA(Asn)/glutamyl-tRNA(Gln) amidotransferase subunit B
MDFEAVMGLEVHVQLGTQSKIFATESFAFGGFPNSHVSPISMAHPGALPSINEACVRSAIKLGLATHCRIAPFTYFARKNYFYPDLPKGYQLSQDQDPICQEGHLELKLESGNRNIRIHRIHLEEDAGKSIHDQDPHYSLIDLNRAGVGLVEIVTHPDFRTLEEVTVFLTEIRKLVRYLEISDGDMEKGNLRCDANVSIRPRGEEKLGTRVEIKNLNSMRNASRAIAYEIERQVSVVEQGGKIEQETRTFHVDTGATSPMRDKETADDYRYFPEPDLLPLQLEAEVLEEIRKEIPALPWERHQRYTQEFGLEADKAETLTERRESAEYFEALLAAGLEARLASNWQLGPIRSYLNDQQIDIDRFPIPPQQMAALAQLVEHKQVTLKVAKGQLFEAMLESPQATPLALARQLNLLLESQEDELEAAMKQLTEQFPEETARYRKGQKKLAGFFVGQLMRKFKGKADPKEVNRVVREVLG